MLPAPRTSTKEF